MDLAAEAGMFALPIHLAHVPNQACVALRHGSVIRLFTMSGLKLVPNCGR